MTENVVQAACITAAATLIASGRWNTPAPSAVDDVVSNLASAIYQQFRSKVKAPD